MREEAFEKAVMLHKDRVHAYATVMLRDAAEAQDVAQEALVRLWEHRRQVEQRGAKSWLMRTARNLCIDRIRRVKVRSEVGDGDEVVETEADQTPSPEKLTESGELGRKLGDALAALSPQDRSVIVLREVQGLPYDEIASILDLPLGTLKARLHRARERLRTRLSRAGVGV